MKASFLSALGLFSVFCFPLRADSDLVGNSEYTSRSTMRLAPVARIRWQDIERLDSGRIQSSEPLMVPNPEPKSSDERTPPPSEAIKTYERTDFYDGCGFMASTSFQGAPFDSSIVPDVMGAVSGEFVFTTLNGTVQIQRRDGSLLGSV
jgi:hypothetical protein